MFSAKYNNYSFSFYTATSIVVANMIGTGVFVSLGFQVKDLTSGFAILALWFLGGAISLFGAFAYAELGAAKPRSGGEYHLLSVIYHQSIGFLAGWVSCLVGFAAPLAAASIAFSWYLLSSLKSSLLLTDISENTHLIFTSKFIAISIIVVLTAVHSFHKKIGASFQNIMTAFKILVILLLILLGIFHNKHTNIDFTLNIAALNEMITPAFAISLFFVSYSYSGWNAVVYIAGEIKNPSKNIPLSLISGTILVSFIYIMLNFVFLYTIPIKEMSGQIEIGYLYGYKLLGPQIGNLTGLIIAFLLLSTMSSLIITGPRVTQVMGEDHKLLKYFSRKNKYQVPSRALLIQCLISVFYVITSSFEQIIIYIGFTLNLFTLLTVAGVIINRIKHPDIALPYKTFGYPITPIIFIVISTSILIFGLLYKPYESLAGLIITFSGFIIYFADKYLNKNLKIF
ncbi:MAG: amino acid permease [Cytophagales bacterium]|nr:amino acid permease [Cytophagales bacterium]